MNREPDIATERLAAVDGLRGIAILLVLVYHFCHVPIVSDNLVDRAFYGLGITGWIGVDLFFVISGFLITRILLSTRRSPDFFKTFYARRVLRIFPLYYGYLLVLAVGFAVASHFPFIPVAKIAGGFEGQIWLWTYLSNLGLFSKGAPLSPATGHLWSLAIEEQFYLLWPLAIYLLERKVLLRVTVSLILLAPVVRSVLTVAGFNGLQIYVFTLSRVDALAWGSLLAVISTDVPAKAIQTWARRGLWITAPLGFVALAVWGPRGDANPWMYSLGLSIFPAVFVAALAIAVLDASSVISRAVDQPLLRFFGKYSYGIYMVHVIIRALLLLLVPAPLVILGTQLIWQLGFMVLAGGTSIVVAFVSWHLYESQFLKLKRYFPYTTSPSTQGGWALGRARDRA